MADNPATYFTIKSIELESSVQDGYDKDSLERFLNQYISRGVQGPVKYFCTTESEVFAKMRIVMEFMQQNLASINEIFEMIHSIELEQWLVETNGKIGQSNVVKRENFPNRQITTTDFSKNQLLNI
tara:strand:- start:94 stop:471 length:378 start_codon:yes stop_codon:yes gene_type:complete